ncbi:hypothetical protein [Kordiimonas sp.]|uniref:hypothetical protein n=1 Tax=Kordiimonas sp. TaxID=1970157 RepID=UPI003A9366A9
MKAAIFVLGCVLVGASAAGGMYLVNRVAPKEVAPLPQPPTLVGSAAEDMCQMIEVANQRRRSGEMNQAQYEEAVAMFSGMFVLMQDDGEYDMSFILKILDASVDDEYKFDVNGKVRELKAAGKI